MAAVSAKAENLRGRSRRFQQFPYAPDVIAYASGHRRRNSERFVNSAEVVEREPARNAGPVILPFLRECVCKSGEATIAHARAQVAAFDNRCADSFRIWISEDWDYLHRLNFSWAIPRFAFAPCAVDLDERRESSQAVMKSRSDRRPVRRESVGGDLKLAVRCRRMSDAFNKCVRRMLVALPHCDVENQLRVTFNRNECVSVAKILIVLGTNALLLLAYEGPKLVALNVAHFDIADLIGHNALALLASENQQLENRCVMNLGNALDGRNGITFEQEFEDHLGLLDRQVHAVQVIFPEFQEHLGALTALVALVTLAVTSVAFTINAAIVAGHYESP